MMRNYVAAGGSILLHSTEIPELVHLATASWFSTTGVSQPSLTGDAITEPAIMRPALGACRESRPMSSAAPSSTIR